MIDWNKIEITKQDCTTIECDILVNAANRFLKRGGGVDGAIHAKAGPRLQDWLDQISGGRAVKIGSCNWTNSGDNRNHHTLFHVVGPDCRIPSQQKRRRQYLIDCFEGIFEMTSQLWMEDVHIVIPNISTGIYGMNKLEAALITFEEIVKCIYNNPNLFKKVTFSCFEQSNLTIYHTLFALCCHCKTMDEFDKIICELYPSKTEKPICVPELPIPFEVFPNIK